jgi:hypothetical protein
LGYYCITLALVGGPSPVLALFRRVADSQASTVKIRGGELTQELNTTFTGNITSSNEKTLSQEILLVLTKRHRAAR